MTAHPHELVPEEPPVGPVRGNWLPAIGTSTREGSTLSASTAICHITVRAPVPMSVALTETSKLPPGVAASRPAQPKCSAPSRRHSTRCRLL